MLTLRLARTKRSQFRYLKTSPKIALLAVMLYVRFPLSLRNVEDLLHERGIDVSHETIRLWWNRFAPMVAVEIRHQRVYKKYGNSNWYFLLYASILGEASNGGICQCETIIYTVSTVRLVTNKLSWLRAPATKIITTLLVGYVPPSGGHLPRAKPHGSTVEATGAKW